MSVREYIFRRLLMTVATLIAVSIVSFAVMSINPNDMLHNTLRQMELNAATGDARMKLELEALIREFDLDKPWYERYAKWAFRVLQGDFGRSMTKPQGGSSYGTGGESSVLAIMRDKVPFTALLTILGTLVSYLVSFPLGIFCALKQYSVADFIITAIAFVGMAVPAFLIALVLLWTMYELTGRAEVGFFSMPYRMAPWSWDRVVDLLRHLPIPLLIVGIGGTGGTIRTMRAILLDELKKPYVTTARAKGMPEMALTWKYPIRVASNPIVSGVGGLLPGLISGGTIVEIVLDLPTMGPLLFSALMNGDMYVAGSVLMIITTLGVVGVMISDMLLAVVDPRIRFERSGG